MEMLLDRHYSRLYGICRRLAGNDADAADGCQEALIAIVRGLPRFDGRSSFKTWSHRVATNACLDELRRRQRRPVASEHVAEMVDEPTRFDEQLAERAALNDVLLQIPDEFRAAVVLRDVIGLDYAEIAEDLDLPPGTVRSRIARGRRHLARLLAAADAAASTEGASSSDGDLAAKSSSDREPGGGAGTSDPLP